GSNPWPLLIPCHRVVSASGKMTGFSGPGGVSTKVKLLALEGAQLLAE
ncbi:MAG: MGMT family protein, partial [Opitutaceae bacterium]